MTIGACATSNIVGNRLDNQDIISVDTYDNLYPVEVIPCSDKDSLFNFLCLLFVYLCIYYLKKLNIYIAIFQKLHADKHKSNVLCKNKKGGVTFLKFEILNEISEFYAKIGENLFLEINEIWAK